jgi:hypothetical protein
VPLFNQVKVTLRLTVSQSVCLGVNPKSGTFDQKFFLSSKLLFCFFGAPSLTRGRVCHVLVFVIEVYHSLVYLQQYLHLNYVVRMGRRRTLIDYWWESQRERDH